MNRAFCILSEASTSVGLSLMQRRFTLLFKTLIFGGVLMRIRSKLESVQCTKVAA